MSIAAWPRNYLSVTRLYKDTELAKIGQGRLNLASSESGGSPPEGSETGPIQHLYEPTRFTSGAPTPGWIVPATQDDKPFDLRSWIA